MHVHICSTASKYRRLSSSQRSVLELTFAKNVYPDHATINSLAKQLGRNEQTLYNWFRMERFRVKKGKNQQTQSIGKPVYIHSLIQTAFLLESV